MDNKCLSDYSVDPNTNLFLCPRLVGGSTPKCYLDAKMLDASFDYDFTNMRDDGTKFYRGGKPYYRPYGWYRHALKVRGKYDDDLWLGDDAIGHFNILCLFQSQAIKMIHQTTDQSLFSVLSVNFWRKLYILVYGRIWYMDPLSLNVNGAFKSTSQPQQLCFPLLMSGFN